MDSEPANVVREAVQAPPARRSEYCPGCPVPHPFVLLGPGRSEYTHDVGPDGNLVCHLCTEARPCSATVVAGRGGFAFRRADRLEDRPHHRGLNWNGPIH